MKFRIFPSVCCAYQSWSIHSFPEEALQSTIEPSFLSGEYTRRSCHAVSPEQRVSRSKRKAGSIVVFVKSEHCVNTLRSHPGFQLHPYDLRLGRNAARIECWRKSQPLRQAVSLFRNMDPHQKHGTELRRCIQSLLRDSVSSPGT